MYRYIVPEYSSPISFMFTWNPAPELQPKTSILLYSLFEQFIFCSNVDIASLIINLSLIMLEIIAQAQQLIKKEFFSLKNRDSKIFQWVNDFYSVEK
ncbi:hypothetical protein BpHYR1_052353 [Brachionus plicatilis]|uniref:Uncharacterized protein n=1 Tax=Brachionus plicatilis TaxID=10195 RepID=A0A3M7SA23_BRAPC|nr:hypothetical protein BpHYR1_052353 [Brachionus plicatilis]